jgi:sugar/nucleoside kinase (ribokinase family)
MQTYLGACTELAEADVNEITVGKPKVIMLEGYVWDIPEGPALATAAIRIAKENGDTVAISLSDSFCVERHQEEFMGAIKNGVDIVLADEDEMFALLGVTTFEEVVDGIVDFDNLFAITRSAKGSVVIHNGEKHTQPATAVEKVVDSTGAGDAYCAGFLFGWTQDKPLAECARLGTVCATSVIQQVGGRIEKDVRDQL